MGSAWRWTSFHAPSSRRKVLVTRSSKEVGPARPATFALHRSTATIVARFAVRYSATVVTSVGSPSRNCAAAWSRARATSCQPRTVRPKGFAKVTSSRRGKRLLAGSGSPLPKASSAVWYTCTTSASSISDLPSARTHTDPSRERAQRQAATCMAITRRPPNAKVQLQASQ